MTPPIPGSIPIDRSHYSLVAPCLERHNIIDQRGYISKRLNNNNNNIWICVANLVRLPISAADAVQISELLSKTIADAHARTCFYTLDQIHDGMYRTATMAAANKATADKLIMYKTMVSCYLGVAVYGITYCTYMAI